MVVSVFLSAEPALRSCGLPATAAYETDTPHTIKNPNKIAMRFILFFTSFL